MKKLLLGGIAAVTLGVAPAAAEVTVEGTLDYTRDRLVIENIFVTKTVDLNVTVLATPTKFAESYAIFNQDIVDNEACENCAEKTTIIRDSMNISSGLSSANQASGNLNNQGTVVAFAFDADTEPTEPPGGETGEGFAEALAGGTQVNDDNFINSVNIIFRDSLLVNSANDNSGLLYINQAAGNMNNQVNALSIAVSLNPGVALAESDLGQFNTNNVITEDVIFKTATINTSILGNQGIVGVNQASGNNANQANVVSIAIAGTGL